MIVRRANSQDMAALAGIFYRSVRIGAEPFYDDAQRAAWAPTQPDAQGWAARLEGLITVVAQDAGRITGFMSLRTSDGYLDLAFVEPDARRTGVAGELYQDIERRAQALGLLRLHTEASHMAKRFFEKNSWQTERAHYVTRKGVRIDNWIMTKDIETTT